MQFRGVALLAGCFIVGQLLGETLGRVIHIDANIGGVGFAMILLVLAQEWLAKHDNLTPQLSSGIQFWSNTYIPVIVAMSSIQNVRVAVSSGLLALLAGLIPVVVCLLLVPVLTKFAQKTQSEWTS